ncbi:hypothetical protein [Bifidobacterium callitrichidarum]|uniref:Uncharacterized protein n=1 Tax=Bifidobacterium callitrichidarum TaxID=2052941 RepID=A0A2U2N8V6_9BIFI|nr:hypothetical protein [Bifidobacterium callitrichidarum]PWG65580.1 hypothetical protein DF196_06495 [Bifidobacterium callitrichidarum]
MTTRFEQVRRLETRTVRVFLDKVENIRIRPSGGRESRQIDVESIQFQLENQGNGFALPTTYGVAVNGGITAFLDRDNDQLRGLVIREARNYLRENSLKAAPDFRNPAATK